MPALKNLTTLLSCSVLLVACGSEEVATQTEAANLAAAVELNELLDVVSERPELDQAQYFGDHVWMVGYNGHLYESVNSGYTWERTQLPVDGEVAFMQFEDGGLRGLVVTNKGVMLRSEDSGKTWVQTTLDDHIGEDVYTGWGAYYADFTFDSDLLNGTWVDHCQIFQTTDGGQSWTRHADALQNNDEDLLCVDRAVADSESGLILAAVDVSGRILTSGSYLFRSDDAGITWQEICSLDEIGMLLKSVKSCYDDVEDMPPLFLELDDEIRLGDTEILEEVSLNAYAGIFVHGSLPIPASIMDRLFWVSMYEDSESDRVWYAEGSDIAYTDDAGQSWQVVSMEMPGNDDVDFSFGVDRGFGALQGEYFAITEDMGKTWRALNSEPAYIYDFATLPQHNRVIVAFEGRLSLLDTNSLTWSDVSNVGEVDYLVVAGNVVWAFSSEEKSYRSEDAGLNWSVIPVDFEDVYFYNEAATCDERNCILTGSSEDAAVGRLSLDPPGFEFTELSDDISDLDEEWVFEIIFDADLQRGWAAIDYGRVFGTQDGGRSWKKLADLGDELTDFSRSPGGDNFIARGYEDRYLRSGDGIEFEKFRAPIGRNGYLSNMCWLNDSTALMSAEDDDGEGEELFLASTDGGQTWGPTSWQSYDDDCVIRGGLVTLNGNIGVLK